MLFVNAALTPEPLGVGGILPVSNHNTCSVWESCSQLRSACFTKVALLKLKAKVSQRRARTAPIKMAATGCADDKFNKYAHSKTKI